MNPSTSLRRQTAKAKLSTSRKATTPQLTHVKRSRSLASDYVPLDANNPLVARGAVYRVNRLSAGDMLSTEEAAALAGTSRMTINQWIKAGRCIALTQLKRGYRLPRWQFDPAVWEHLPEIVSGLATHDGWSLLTFLESPHPALDGLSPRAALEQGASTRVLNLAMAEAH
jgi:excisionase family DNA binding protein